MEEVEDWEAVVEEGSVESESSASEFSAAGSSVGGAVSEIRGWFMPSAAAWIEVSLAGVASMARVAGEASVCVNIAIFRFNSLINYNSAPILSFKCILVLFFHIIPLS